MASSEREARTVTLSGGEAGDCPNGIELLMDAGEPLMATNLVMDKAYSSNKMRVIARTLNYIPIVPPKTNSKEQWEYDKQQYKERNRIERLFGWLKARFRKIFTRYDKLDVIFLSFIYFGLSVHLIKISVNTP